MGDQPNLETCTVEDAGRHRCAMPGAAEDGDRLPGRQLGEAIRGQTPRALERPDRVVEAITREPTIIGGPRRNLFETALGRVALAAAASVATIGVVSWIGTQGGAPGTIAPIAAKGPSAGIKPVAATTSMPGAQPSLDVQDYVTAHRQIPSLDAYRPVANHGAAAAR